MSTTAENIRFAHCPEAEADIKAKAFDTTTTDDPGWIEGYLAVFGNVDQQDERILPGAFTKTIQERVPTGKVPLMAMHFGWGGDVNEVIGTITEAREDAKGLWIHADLSKVSLAQDIRTKILEGHVRGLSVGYRVIQAASVVEEGKTVMELSELMLREGTVTVKPANEEAGITDAKSQDGGSIATVLNEITQRLDKLESKTTETKDGAGKATTPENDSAGLLQMQETLREQELFLLKEQADG